MLLLDGIVFEFHRENRAKLFSDPIESADRLFGIEFDEFGDHEVAEDFDFVFVAKAGDHAVVEIGATKATVVSLHEGV